MQALDTLTTFINLLALAVSLWLGFYIITRSPRSMLSRLAALTLWFLGSYFLCNALVLNSPPNILYSWLRQLVLLVLPLWLHLTWLVYSRPTQDRDLSVTLNRYAIPLAYLTAGALIVIGILPTDPPVGILGSFARGQPGVLGLSSRGVGSLYFLFLADVLVFGLLSLANLWRARAQTSDAALASPFNALFIATALAAAGAIYSGLITWLSLDLPTFPADIALGSGVVLLGYTVARYAALLEGRPLDRDFVYTILVVGALTLAYGVVAFLLYLGGQLSFLTLVLILAGAIAGNSLFDGIRLTLDRIFYQRQFQQLRGNLRALAREAGTSETLNERLQAILDALCRTLSISNGMIAVNQGEHYVVLATREANSLGQILEASELTCNETIGLVRSTRKGLPGMTLLVPLYAAGIQIGALVLGPKETQRPYVEADLDLVEDLGDQIASVIHTAGLQEENARTLNALVQDFREKERTLQLQVQQLLAARVAEAPREEESPPAAGGIDEEVLLPQVEEGLRRLHDFAFLGERPLAKLRLVERRLQARGGTAATFIERGKVVSEVLVQALEELRPDSAEPEKNQVPPREWHPFIILHDSYVLDEPNRAIMSRLYISEGTFNRTRRRALRSVAKSLAEMEERIK